MDLRKELLREHSRKQALRIAAFIGQHANRLKTLVDLYSEGPYRVMQRAAWPLSLVAERHPELFVRHLKILLKEVTKEGAHPAVKRNTMRILQFMEIPKRYHARVIDISFTFLQCKTEPVAVKVFAMTVLSTLTQNQPDLQKELKIILEDQLPYASAGFRSRAGKVLKKLVV